jgi:hypothetical protein
MRHALLRAAAIAVAALLSCSGRREQEDIKTPTLWTISNETLTGWPPADWLHYHVDPACPKLREEASRWTFKPPIQATLRDGGRGDEHGNDLARVRCKLCRAPGRKPE